MKKNQLKFPLLIFSVGLAVVIACTEKTKGPNQPVIVPIDQLTAEPRVVNFVSINEKKFNQLLENLKREGVQDSTLNPDVPGIYLISTSPYKDGEYLIHPPFGRLANTFPIEVVNRQDALEYMIKCGNHQRVCDCLNGISSHCYFPKNPLPSPCIAGISIDAVLNCKPKNLCAGPSACRKVYQFIKLPGEGNKNWEALAIGCKCEAI